MLSLPLNDKKFFNTRSFKPCAIFYSVHSNYDFISLALKNLIFQRSYPEDIFEVQAEKYSLFNKFIELVMFHYFDLSLTISGNNYYLQNAS